MDPDRQQNNPSAVLFSPLDIAAGNETATTVDENLGQSDRADAMVETSSGLKIGLLVDAGSLRQIRAFDAEALAPNTPTSGPPIVEWIDPRLLYVDEQYQRGISTAGEKLIVRIIQNWDWSRFKPPITCFEEIDGQTVLKVTDGQHTAIAAASHPSVEQIPVVIVDAPDTASQARSFIGHNTDRLAVTNLQIHHAAIAAGDDKALTVEHVCQRAGVGILKQPPGDVCYSVGDTLAVKGIYALVERRFAKGAREILEVLVNAEFAPITIAQIKGVEFLMTDADHAGKLTVEDLIEAIKGCYHLDHEEAKRLSVTHKAPLWRALAMVWFRKCKKRRQARKGLER